MTDQIPSEIITGKIHLIRGRKVMLDRDLAELYGVQTKVLKQAVRRNIDRFPGDFMFELTKEEIQPLRSQNVTLKRGQHSKYFSFAFTEQGVAMLSSVLRTDRAIQVNIQIMRTFTQLRKMLSTHEDLKKKIESIENRYDEQIEHSPQQATGMFPVGYSSNFDSLTNPAARHGECARYAGANRLRSDKTTFVRRGKT
jgi:phage regulator Rha-like protein